MIAVDLESGKVASLPAGDGAFFEGVRATRWIGDSIFVLRRRPDRIEVVRVDVARLLGRS